MQNYLKYGKISEICDINGYFAGKKNEKNCACGAQKGNSHKFLKWGKRIQLLVRTYYPDNIYSSFMMKRQSFYLLRNFYSSTLLDFGEKNSLSNPADI